MATLSQSSPAHDGPVPAQASIAAAPAKRKRTAGAVSSSSGSKKKPKKDKTFDTEMKRAEVWMDYTGKYDDWSDGRERSAGLDVSFKLGTMIQKIADAARDPDASWGTKKNAINAVCHIVMAVLCAPVGRCAREVRHNIYDIEMAFESAVMEALSAEERMRLATDDEGAWMHFLADLEEQANSYCILGKIGKIRQKLLQEAPLSPANNENNYDNSNNNSSNNDDDDEATETSHQSPEVRARPKTPLGRAPWYPVSFNKPIMVPEVPNEPASDQTAGGPPERLDDQDFTVHLRTLRSDMGPGSKYARCRSEKTLSKGAHEIVGRAQVAAMHMLRSTAREGTTWASKLNAFDTLLGMCGALAGCNTSLWNDTDIATFVCGQCAMIDQVLMRLVQRMDLAERARLAREEDLVDRLEDVMRVTRRQRRMAELETVKDWLLAAL